MKLKISILVLLLAFAKAEWALSQNIPTKKKPKIGLVLSGGGAKGFAHVGVLKVIDSLGIKLDYVAGTSMGAIVGSLYAAGYNGKQLDSIIRATDFSTIISDEIPRNSKSIKEKENFEKYAVTLPFKDFKIQLPSSLSKGQNVYNLLSRLLSHVKEVDDFSKLPIPFLCMATDIENGEEVVLDSGYLPEAVNASGALPSLFAPVEIDGRLLIDGGVTDNYPIEKLRKRGMDIIIGVDVQDDFRPRNELLSALDILAQINNFNTINAMKSKGPETDIYISPDIKGYTVVSFTDANKIIDLGEKSALRYEKELKEIATPAYQRPRLKNAVNDSIHITQINIVGHKNYSRAYILGRFKIETPNTVSYDKISEGINNLQATNNFSKINYKLKPLGNGTELELNVIETDVRNYLHLGIHYDELFKSAALVNLTRKNLLLPDDAVSADLILGDNFRYNLDYFLDKGKYWSVGFHSDLIRFDTDVSTQLVSSLGAIEFPGINTLDLEYREWNQRLYLQTSLYKQLNLTTGIELKSQNIFTQTAAVVNRAADRTVLNNNTTTGIYGSVLLDSFDNFSYPNEGWRVKGDFHFYLWNTEFKESFNEFSIAQLEVSRAMSSGKFSVTGTGNIGITIGEPQVATYNFFLGGYGNKPFTNFKPFYGYNFISFGGDSMLKFLIDVDYEIFKKNHLSFHANFASAERGLFEKTDWLTRATYTGYALGYGIETFLGPIELKYSFTPQQSGSEIFVVVGFRF